MNDSILYFIVNNFFSGYVSSWTETRAVSEVVQSYIKLYFDFVKNKISVFKF
jgi:hypothetical protein